MRRRRECTNCKERFTTYESAELVMPRIIKRDDNREPFDEAKLRGGIVRSLDKRPVSMESVEGAVERVDADAVIGHSREEGVLRAEMRSMISARAVSGVRPGRTMNAAQPSPERSRAGMTPARTNDDLPAPDGPTTAIIC